MSRGGGALRAVLEAVVAVLGRPGQRGPQGSAPASEQRGTAVLRPTAPRSTPPVAEASRNHEGETSPGQRGRDATRDLTRAELFASARR